MRLGGVIAVTVVALFLLLSIPTGVHAGDEAAEEPGHMNRIAVMETDYGVIKFELYEDWTPITAENFIGLAEAGHYNGVRFHRIVDDFVIQTGDGGGSSSIPLETHPNATHVDGAVGMARSSDPNSASDQFYICDGPQHGLDDASVNPDGQDPGYAVFGIVIYGMDVVRAIAEVPVYGESNPRPGEVVPLLWLNMGEPQEDVFVKTITIETPSQNVSAQIEKLPAPSSGGMPVGIIVLVLAVAAVAAFVMFDRTKGRTSAST